MSARIRRTNRSSAWTKKPVSLHEEVRPPRPARPGHLAKRDNEYRRCGTANVFGIVEPKAGRHFTCASPDRSAQQFALMVRRVVTAYPRARVIHLVMDNLNIHCEKSLTDTFGPREGRRIWRRLRVHFTPKHGSWLNQAELELSLVSRGCFGARRIDTLARLAEETRAWSQRADCARAPASSGVLRERTRVASSDIKRNSLLGHRPSLLGALLPSKHTQRVCRSRAQRRQISGDARDDSDEQDRSGNDARIERAHVKEQRRDQPRRGERAGQPEREGDEGDGKSLPQYHAAHGTGVRAECHANTELARAQSDRE